MKGSIVAIVTPMLKNGDIDFVAFEKLLGFHSNAGTDGIVLVGTTGESATLTIDWEYTEDVIETIQSLKNKGTKVVSVEQADKSLKIGKFTPEKGVKYAFIFGNEVDGVSDEIILESDRVLEIPQVGTKHSLNVSVAAGIILWDFYQKTEI